MQESTRERSLLLTPEEREELAEHSQRVTYPARTTLVREHERSDFVLYIDDGYVKAVAQQTNTIVALHGPGAVVGELAPVTGTSRSADLVALTDVEALYIPGRIWYDFIQTHTRALWAHYVDLAHRHRSKDLSREESLMSSERKLARSLAMLVDAGLLVTDGTDYVLNGFTQQDLGNLAGISRESVSATLGHLRKAKAISTHRGGVRIHDIEIIRKLADREDQSV